jgi:hypothetical protein
MENKKQTAVKWFKNLFKQKSPCCNKQMNDVGIHQFWGGSQSIVYECNKCKRLWI